MSATVSPNFADTGEGTDLPELVIPVTRTLIVAGAIASRDYQDVHHDHELATDKGSADIIMNILTTNGLVGRYITDWAGPDAVVRAIRIRLGVPNHPGDTMTLTGQVTATDPDTRTVTVGIRGCQRPGQPCDRHRGGDPAMTVNRPGNQLGWQGRHRGHRCHRVFQGLGPQRAEPGLRIGVGRHCRRRPVAV